MYGNGKAPIPVSEPPYFFCQKQVILVYKVLNKDIFSYKNPSLLSEGLY